MPKIPHLSTLSRFLLLSYFIFMPYQPVMAVEADPATGVQQCIEDGWSSTAIYAGGLRRSILWKQPTGRWPNGAIVVLHGGGGSHYQFCAGGNLVQPQIAFTRLAIEQGFAVFLLDSTTDIVTDAAMQECGKRFDFSVLDRANVDLPFIDKVISQFVPTRRPWLSNRKIFLTGLSTGGFMTIRAATNFDDKITAFAPVSAGDPYGTETNCDPDLSSRTSAKGILTDIETGKEIIEPNACLTFAYPNEKDGKQAALCINQHLDSFIIKEMALSIYHA